MATLLERSDARSVHGRALIVEHLQSDAQYFTRMPAQKHVDHERIITQ